LKLAQMCLLVSALQIGSISAGQATAQKKNLTPEEIIEAFSAKESEFYEAWIQYAYRQDAVVRVLSVDGRPAKERMVLVSEVVFRDDGTREVRQVQRSGQLRSVKFTREDEEVINNIQPFSLTVKELPLYNLKYQGKERVDELDCYVFSVKPKSTKGDRFYFEGKIWVDDVDLQIVRTVGKPVPERDQKFPEFETLRQIIERAEFFRQQDSSGRNDHVYRIQALRGQSYDQIRPDKKMRERA